MGTTAILTQPRNEWGVRDSTGEIVAVCSEAEAWRIASEDRNLDIVKLTWADNEAD